VVYEGRARPGEKSTGDHRFVPFVGRVCELFPRRKKAMVENNIGVLAVLRKQLEDAGGDLPREMLRAVAEKLMSAEADALCNAAYGERSRERENKRNGYRERAWDTRVGTEVDPMDWTNLGPC
jgi:hypothetical protein